MKDYHTKPSNKVRSVERYTLLHNLMADLWTGIRCPVCCSVYVTIWETRYVCAVCDYSWKMKGGASHE